MILLPFETHTIYLTLDDDKIYRLNADFSRVVVESISVPSRTNSILVMHKKQLDINKRLLFDTKNLMRMSLEDAITYNMIGFVSDDELTEFTRDLGCTVGE